MVAYRLVTNAADGARDALVGTVTVVGAFDVKTT
jgi:hypothetical protein